MLGLFFGHKIMSKPDFLSLSDSVRIKVINGFDRAIRHQNEITEKLKNYPEDVIEYGHFPVNPMHPCHGICLTLVKMFRMGNHSKSELEELTEFVVDLTDVIQSRLGSTNLYLQHWLISQGYSATKRDLKLKVNAIKLSETRAAWLKSLKEEFCHEYES